MRTASLSSVLGVLFVTFAVAAAGCSRTEEAERPPLGEDAPSRVGGEVGQTDLRSPTPAVGGRQGEPTASAGPLTQNGGDGTQNEVRRPQAATPVVKPTPQAIARPGTTPATEGTPTPVARRLTGPRSVPASPGYTPSSLVTDATLEREIRALLGREVESYGIVVKRLSDGRGTQINADREFYAASLYKLLVMYEVFKQRRLDLLSFDERLTITPPYLEYQLLALPWPVWSEASIEELLEAMITWSSNVAAMLLHDKTGGWNIIQDLKAVGLTHTDLASDRLPTSAGDMALLLEMIARGKAVDEASSEEMIDLLARQEVRDRLPALLPQGTKVAHKTGNWENATHDVGIVFAPNGAYIIAVLSDRAWEAKPIAELSRLVYEHFEGSGATNQ